MEQVTDHILAAARKVIAVHINYPSRAAQRGRTPEQPSYFLKPSSSLATGSAEAPTTVERPAGCELLGYEGEIALIIGKPARRVGLEDAWSHVEWVTASNDLGVYDLRYADKGSNLRSKGGDGFTPVGPALIAGGRRRPRRDCASAPGTTANSSRTTPPKTCSSRSPGSSPTCPSCSPSKRATSSSPAPPPAPPSPGRATSSRLRCSTTAAGGAAAGLTTGRLATRVEEGTTPFADFGARPKTDDLQREEAYGSREAAGLAPVRGRRRRACPDPGTESQAGERLHRHAVLPAAQARPEQRQHRRPQRHPPGEAGRGPGPDPALRAQPRGPLQDPRRRLQRPEEGHRLRERRRDPRHGGPRRKGHRHHRRHPGPARPGPRRRGHHHRRRRPRLLRRGRHGHAHLLRQPAPRRPGPPAHPVGHGHHHRLRRHHRPARRHHRGRLRRHPGHPAGPRRGTRGRLHRRRNARKRSSPKWWSRATAWTASTR